MVFKLSIAADTYEFIMNIQISNQLQNKSFKCSIRCNAVTSLHVIEPVPVERLKFNLYTKELKIGLLAESVLECANNRKAADREGT